MKTYPQSLARAASGFTLLEVLIAVVVLATGLLALTALQGALIRSSADAKARSQVAAYLAGEMDRIRSGVPIQPTQSAVAGGTDEISKAAAAAALGSLDVTTSITQYVDVNGTFIAQNPAINPGGRSYFNRMALAARWTDATGGTRTLTLQTDISPLSLSASKVLVDREPPDDLGLRPIVRRQSPLTEGMIPIATGGADGEATAATNPKPRLSSGDSGAYLSDTRFDILTYSRDQFTPEGFARFNKRIETAVVGCACRNDLNGFPTSGANAAVNSFLRAQAFRPTVWDGRAYLPPVIAASGVTTSPAAVSQSELCDVCCRDHKDPSTESGAKYSPWQGQDPAHYRYNTSGSLVLAGAGEQYVEACRVVRVGGSFRVAPDARILDAALVATQDAPPVARTGSTHPNIGDNTSATSPRLSQPGTTAYEKYVYGAVASLYFSGINVAASGNSTDFPGLQGDGLNEPQYVPIKPSADRRWMHGRVIMADYLESDARDVVVRASSECDPPPGTDKLKAQCVLGHVPLATINVTEIAEWTPRAANSTDSIPAALSAEPLGYLNFARSSIRRFNTGLALYAPINPNDGADPALDEQLFIQLAATEPSQSPWLHTPSPNPSTARFFGDPLNPMRGYAETSAPHVFVLSWNFPTGNPGSPVTDNDKNNDPSATVAGGGACTQNPAGNTSNPYGCKSSSLTSFQMTLAGYNRIIFEQIRNPCPNASSSSKVDRPVCVVYGFSGASVDNPSAAATGVSTSNTGTIREQTTFTIPAIVSGGSSRVTTSFTGPTQTSASHTCPDGINPVWTIPCE